LFNQHEATIWYHYLFGKFSDDQGNLKNGQQIQLHCHDVEKRTIVDRRFVANLAGYIAWAKDHSGLGNCFVGRNVRDGAGGGCLYVSSVSFDIDPIRDKNTPSTQSQIEEAVNAGKYIQSLYPGGSIAFTGNGTLVLYSFADPVRLDATQLVEWETQYKMFEDHIRTVLKERFSGVRLDNTYDTSRLVKLIGTESVKFDRRNTNILVFPGERSNSIYESIKLIPKGPPISGGELLVQSNYPSRSEAIFALAVHCKKAGYNAETCLNVLKNNPYGRTEKIDDIYRIIRKVYLSGGPSYGIGAGGDFVLHHSTTIEGYKKFMEKSAAQEFDLKSGYEDLDGLTLGLKRGELYVVAARPGIGKTSLLLNMIYRLLSDGKRVLFLSTEMRYEDIWTRFISIFTGFDTQKLIKMDLNVDEQKQAEDALIQFAKYDWVVCDSFNPTHESVDRMAEGVKPDVLIFDHIQHIQDGDTVATLSTFTRSLKEMALRLNMSVVVASQFKRPLQMMNYKTSEVIMAKPTLSDLKGCGTLEQEASVVVGLSEVEINGREILSLRVLKNRYGPKKELLYGFQKASGRIVELE